MLAIGKTLLTSHLRPNGASVIAPSLVIGSHRTIVSAASYIRLGVAANRRRKMRKKTSLAVRKRIQAKRELDKDITIDIARAMPMSYQEMDNSTLVTLGAMENHEARIEILKRHIMSTDGVSHDEASKTFDQIAKKNREGMYMLSLPYQIGITMALTAGFCSIPLVFYLPTVEWFNHYYVTTDVPEPEDLETALEVGSWAWNWMEPPLGQISFFLLCLQYSRSQMENLGIKPYTRKIKQMRAEKLANAFPEYDARLLINYSMSADIYQKDQDP